jgi:hypothetical protein
MLALLIPSGAAVSSEEKTMMTMTNIVTTLPDDDPRVHLYKAELEFIRETIDREQVSEEETKAFGFQNMDKLVDAIYDCFPSTGPVILQDTVHQFIALKRRQLR